MLLPSPHITLSMTSHSNMDVLLVKAPLLLLEVYCAAQCMRIPNPAATAHEQDRYSKKHKVADTLARHGPLAPRNVVQIVRHLISMFAFAELAVLVTAAFTPSTHLLRVFLLPTTQWIPKSERISPVCGANMTPGALDIQALRPTITTLVGLLLVVAGAYLRVLSFRYLGAQFTLELSLRQGHHLVTSGPYAYVRHPSYIAGCVFSLGTLLMGYGPGSLLAESGVWCTAPGLMAVGTGVGFAVLSLGLLVRRVPGEDAVLRREFKEEWEAYAKRTPYRLIPFVY